MIFSTFWVNIYLIDDLHPPVVYRLVGSQGDEQFAGFGLLGTDAQRGVVGLGVAAALVQVEMTVHIGITVGALIFDGEPEMCSILRRLHDFHAGVFQHEPGRHGDAAEGEEEDDGREPEGGHPPEVDIFPEHNRQFSVAGLRLTWKAGNREPGTLSGTNLLDM